MGECISYPRLPNMAPVKQAGKIRFVNAGRGWLVNLDSLARYFEQGDPAPVELTPAAPSVRRVCP